MNFLEKIIEEKKIENKEKERKVKEEFEKSELKNANFSFLKALEGEGLKVIAEIKRKSPTKEINPYDDIFDRAKKYEIGGADAISVLTDKNFLGKEEDMKISKFVNVPVLRKDFVIDEIQILECAIYGVSSFLLISEALDEKKLEKLIETGRKFGMEPLVECFTEEGIKKIEEIAKIIGINNRNLFTLEVDIKNTPRIIEKMKNNDKIIISESGIKSFDDIRFLKKYVKRFLIGEWLMTEKKPQEIIKKIKSIK